MTGEVALARPLPFIASSGQLEAVKWLALALMLCEHFFRFTLDALPGWAYLLGRLVFPLFVFAFACGIGSQPWVKVRGAALRLFSWAVVAQFALQLVDPPEPRLNVLFTFGLGLLAVYGLACGGALWRVAAALAVVLLLGPFCDFGLWGVAFVFAVVWLARDDWRSRAGWLLVGATLIGLMVPNQTWFALAAVPVLLLVLRSGVEAPRLRGVFYWTYSGQFPLFAALRGLLA